MKIEDGKHMVCEIQEGVKQILRKCYYQINFELFDIITIKFGS